jgi:hypothetical protein
MVKCRNVDGTFCKCSGEDTKIEHKQNLRMQNLHEIVYWMVAAIGIMTIFVVLFRNGKKLDFLIDALIDMVSIKNKTNPGEEKKTL